MPRSLRSSVTALRVGPEEPKWSVHTLPLNFTSKTLSCVHECKHSHTNVQRGM